MAKVNFRTNVLLKSIIGKDLITDDNIAVLELVKNSFDAGSNQVKISFENLDVQENSKLVISDLGSGMSKFDLENKWLNIAYSEKKAKREEYGRILAGNKGVGRFSCDRLGHYLTIYTKKESGSYLKIFINWQWFEEEGKIDLNIQDIQINLDEITEEQFVKKTSYSPFESGTILEIKSLRETWTHTKILSLKRQLERLINPNQSFKANKFDIILEAKEFLNFEKDFGDAQKVNGKVRNRIFEKLTFRVTNIQSKISRDGRTITTILKDRGITIFTLVEKNPFPALKNIRVFIYYLNPYSKAYFTKQTGIRSVDFGSIFLFINGFRIPPYGDYGDDWLGMESRKGQGYKRYLGTREVVGRIEVEDENEDFKIISSRSGVVNDETFTQLTQSDSPYGYYYKIFRRLERFVVEGIKWDSAIEDDNQLEKKILSDPNWDISKERYIEDSFTRNTRIIEVVENILSIKKDDVYRLRINKSFVADLIEEKADLVEQELERIAEQLKSKNLSPGDIEKFLIKLDSSRTELKTFSDIVSAYNENSNLITRTEKTLLKRYQDLLDEKSKIELRLKEEESARVAEENKRKAAEEKLKQATSENLFLKNIKSQDLDEVVSFVHHIGISSGIIDNYLTGLYKKLSSGQKLDSEKIIEILKIAVFENKKIQNISTFATKANFKLYTDAIELNLDEYIREYINNIIAIATDSGIKISFVNNNDKPLIKKLRPIEINILVDNLFSNSKKAGATEFNVSLTRSENNLILSFEDNGKGIDENKLKDIYRYGYTTTEKGSGIGLYHIKEILDRMGAKLEVTSKLGKGTTFKIYLE